MSTDKLAVWLYKNVGYGLHLDMTDCESLAILLRQSGGIAALVDDETIREGMLRSSLREYWENTDGAGLTADE